MPRKPLIASTALLAVMATAAVVAARAAQDDHKVGRQPDGSVVTSTNQVLTPAGRQVEFPGRPNDGAVHPDGKTAAVLNSSGTVVIDLDTGTVIETESGAGSFAGIAYSVDGSKLFTSRNGGTVATYTVDAAGRLTLDGTVSFPGAGGNPYPGGLALTEDAGTLYVALNRRNSLAVVDVATRTVRAEIPVGNAPFGVVLAGPVAYVTNQGGRSARAGEFTNASSGTDVVADPESGSASTGTVSVVDLAEGRVVEEIEVGLHPTAMHLWKDILFVANSNSDTVSVIDTNAREVVSTIAVQPFPEAPFGSSPNALTVLDRNRLVVSLGRNNALAAYTWTNVHEPARFEGLIPTAWYPASISADDTRRELFVVNNKGVGSLASTGGVVPAGGDLPKIVSSNQGSASIIPYPTATSLAEGTNQVFRNNGWDRLDRDYGDPDAVPRAVPRRIGDPSPIEHVFYIIKENRTYDQILGDDPRGDGDPKLTQFGLPVTPNQHLIARQFPLFDNFYVSGSLSADGHQWATQAFVTDYLEKSFTGFVRSYPFDGGDSLAYSPAGFLWENALEQGKGVRVYGEFASGRNAERQTVSDIPSLDRILERQYPPYDLSISDTRRASLFLEDLAAAEESGELPNLNIIQLPLDHTIGTTPEAPTPVGEVANNDLAVGRIVDAISHSRFWKSAAIFITEDDSQAGVDHIDGHRTTAFVVSPYARRGVVDSTYYTQINMVRTIEQILGLPPMNQLDLSAPPMYSAFTDVPNLAPFESVDAGVPMAETNPPLSELRGIERAWAIASASMDFTSPDVAPEQELNRATWYGVHDFSVPYPGDPRILWPHEVAELLGEEQEEEEEAVMSPGAEEDWERALEISRRLADRGAQG